MPDYNPDTQYPAFTPPGSAQADPGWDPYQQYVLPGELETRLATFAQTLTGGVDLNTAIAASVSPEAAARAAADAPIAFTGTFKGDWAGNLVVTLGDVYRVTGVLHRVIVPHTTNSAGFTYDREKWEPLPVPGLHADTEVAVTGLDLTNAGVTGLPSPTVSLFQRRPKKFSYKAKRTLWSVQQASDVAVTGGSVVTGTGKPLGSAVVTCNTSGNTNIAFPTRAAFDASSGFFIADLTLNDPNNRFFSLQVSSDGGWTNYHEGILLWSSNDSAPGPARHATYGIPVSEMTVTGTGANLAAITNARIQTTNGSPALTMEVERLSWHPNSSDKAKVIFWFDDGGLTNQIAAMKVLAKYGFPFMVTPIANSLTSSGAALNGDAARSLQNAYGAMFAPHAFGGNDHNVGAQTGRPLHQQLVSYQHFMMSMALEGGDDLAYWNPGLTQGTSAGDAQTVRKLFRSARTTAGRHPETLPPIDPYRTIAAPGSTAAAMQAFTTKAVPYKGCAQFLYHALSTQNVTDLTNFCIWLDSQRATIDVVTTAGAYDPLSA